MEKECVTSFDFSKTKQHIVRERQLKDGSVSMMKIPYNGLNLDDWDLHSAYDYEYLRMQKALEPKLTSKSIRIIDMFSGCGGLSLGALEACRTLGLNLEHASAVDNNESAIAVYKHNIPNSVSFTEDIENILDGQFGTSLTRTETDFIEATGQPDILLAGPPCQGNSDLNNHTRRDDTRNSLYSFIARYVEIVRPKHILIENIPAVVHGKEGAVQKTINKIKTQGYHIDSGVVSLSKIGVPQKRKRHIVLASLAREFSIANIMKKYSMKKMHTVWWAIHDLVDEKPTSIYSRGTRHTEENISRIKYLHERDLYDLPNHQRPHCHRDKPHSYKSMYGRLKWDEPSQTITSGYGSPGQGRFIHPVKHRTLTPHEAARLQFFPDFFDFSPAKTRKALSQMIGNAAPMKLSYIFCLELLSSAMM